MTPDEIIREDIPLEVAPEQFRTGQIIGAKYKVNAVLGRGGMGIVYRVEQVFIGKEFALKTLNMSHVSDLTMRRFQLEAKAASLLNHPNLVQVHDFGLLDDGQPFLIMDWVDGVTLADKLKRDGPLSVEDAARIFAQVCLGLLYAHDQGVVHRDIKPGNIMLVSGTTPGEEGSVKVLDFGIAKLTMDEEIQSLTRTGEVFGSPFYMSPEQCAAHKVDHRSDVYSLGCVLFEALTGAPPHMGGNPLSTMMAHQTQTALSLREASLGRDFPSSIERIVAKMLRKSPDERYQNLGLVAHDLSAVFQNQPSGNLRLSERPKKKGEKISIEAGHLYALVLGTAVIAATLGAFATYLIGNRPEKSRQPQVTIAPKTPAATPKPVTEQVPLTELEEFKLAEDRLLKKFENKPAEAGYLKLYCEARNQIHDVNRSQESLKHADQLLQQCQIGFDKMPADEEDIDAQRAMVLVERGSCALYLKQISQAEDFVAKAQAIAHKPVVTKGQFAAEIAKQIGQMYIALGQHFSHGKPSKEDAQKAIGYFRKEIAYSDKIMPKYLESAKAQMYIGEVEYAQLGDKKSGIRSLIAAKDRFEKGQHTQESEYVHCLTLLANAFQNDNQPNQAAQVEQELEPLRNGLLATGDVRIEDVRAWSQWPGQKRAVSSKLTPAQERQNKIFQEAETLAFHDQWTAAMPKFEQLSATWKNAPMGLDKTTEALMIYGDCARYLNRLKQAGEIYARARALLEKGNWQTTDRMASIILRQGIVEFTEYHHIGEAKHLFKQSLNIWESLHGRGAVQTAEANAWLGIIYGAEGEQRYDLALTYYQQAEDATKNVDGYRGLYGNVLYGKGQCLLNTNHPVEAESTLKQAKVVLQESSPKDAAIQTSIDAYLKDAAAKARALHH